MKIFALILSLFVVTHSIGQEHPSPPDPTDPMPPEMIEVSLTGHLFIDVSCPPNVPFCFGPQMPINQLFKIKLYLRSYRNDIPENPQGRTYHYRGYHSLVAEVNDVRFIGVLTVDFLKESDDANNWYNIKVEILDNNGQSAELRTGIRSLTDLNYVTLIGDSIKKGDQRYTPEFAIGGSILFPGPIPPTDPVPPNPPLPLPKIPTEKNHSEWEVIKGRISTRH